MIFLCHVEDFETQNSVLTHLLQPHSNYSSLIGNHVPALFLIYGSKDCWTVTGYKTTLGEEPRLWLCFNGLLSAI